VGEGDSGSDQSHPDHDDPHEDLVVGTLFGWTAGPALEVVEKYLESVKKFPNPPAPNITRFRSGG